MKRRTVLGMLGGTTLLGSAVLGTGAFSSVEAKRETKIQVAEDEDAYLGLSWETYVDLNACSGDVKITVTNNTTKDLSTTTTEFYLTEGSIDDIDTSVPKSDSDLFEVEGNEVSLKDTATFDIGYSVDITVSVDFGDEYSKDGTAGLQFDASASDDEGDISIQTDSSREIEIGYDCDGPDACPVNVTVGDTAETDPDVELITADDDIEVDGDVTATGQKSIDIWADDSDIKIDGSVIAKGNSGDSDSYSIKIRASNDNYIRISGDIEDKGNPGDILIEDAEVGGDIISPGGTDITIKNSTVCGDVKIDGNNGSIEIENSEVGGDISHDDCTIEDQQTVIYGDNSNCTVESEDDGDGEDNSD